MLTGLSDAFNAQLLGSLRGRNAVIVDAGKLLSAVQADPVRYGFTAPMAATVPACTIPSSLLCIQGVHTRPDGEQRIFADGVHPTTTAHALFGEAAMAGLRAGTQTGTISVAVLTALRHQSLTLENRLNPTVLYSFDEDGNRTRRAVGDIDFFASAEAGGYRADGQQVASGLTATSQAAKAGFDIAIAPNATVGLGISIDQGQVDFTADRGGFDTRLVVGALFGQAALSERFYVNAVLGAGSIDVYDINRRFRLGPATESYDAESEGTYFAARIGTGAMLPVSEELLLNPFVQYTHERVTIDGFTESPGATNLSFGETEYPARRITAGLSSTWSPSRRPSWKFNLRGSIEHDLQDEDLSVPIGPDAGTLARVSAPRPDRTWGYLSGAVVKAIGDGAFLSLTASTSIGLDGSSGVVGTLAYKKTF